MTSYHGEPISNVDLNEIFRLRDEDHLIDNIVDIKLNLSLEPRVQETEKRNLLIQDAEDNGCSHVIVIDSDEYYTKKSFERGLDMMLNVHIANIATTELTINHCLFIRLKVECMFRLSQRLNTDISLTVQIGLIRVIQLEDLCFRLIKL